MTDINILFPVLNERLRLEKGIDKTIGYVRENLNIPSKITILDNGSEDETPEIGKRLAEKYPEVSYVRVGERGVGVAFRKGIALNECSLVGYMDIDLSTDIKHLGQAVELFQQDETSMGLVFLLKAGFHMKATDAVCGFTFLRKEAAEKLVSVCGDDNGWFYTIEFLLRAERMGMRIYDMPVEWQEDYNTTVKMWKTIKNYLIQMRRLHREFRLEEKRK